MVISGFQGAVKPDPRDKAQAGEKVGGKFVEGSAR
jgi:hypothetical protein